MIGVQQEGRASPFLSATHTHQHPPPALTHNRVAVIPALGVNGKVLSAPAVTHFLIFIQRESSRWSSATGVKILHNAADG